jgi:hypothetical protein
LIAGASVRASVGSLALLGVLLLTDSAAAAAPCQGYLALATRAIKARVEALRLTEREASDRLIGLDTRPYPTLAGQARAAAAAIGDAKALQEEDELARCPEPVPHVRRICSMAAQALAAAIDEWAAGGATSLSKRTYAEAVGICEGLIGLKPLQTRLRTAD